MNYSSIMTHLNYILSHSLINWSSDSVGIDELKNKLSGDFSEAYDKFKKGIIFYRADKKINESLTVITPQTRISSDTSNIYNRLISDVLPSWKNYPKRNRSIIFTNNLNEVERYAYLRQGKIYYIFPKNGARLVISNAADVWEAFKYNNFPVRLDVLNNNLTSFIIKVAKLSKIQLSEGKVQDFFVHQNANNIIRLFNEFNNIPIDTLEDLAQETDILSQTVIDIIKKRNVSFLEALDILLTPSANGFAVKSITDINHNDTSDSSEIWTDSQCLFAEKQLFDSIVNKEKPLNISDDKENLEILARTKCSQILEQYNSNYDNGPVRLYSGVNSSSDYLLLTPSKKLSNSFHNTLISDVLHSWYGYPKINESIILYNRKKYADEYAKDFQSHYALPYNNSNIVVCPENDFLWSFRALDQFGIGKLTSFDFLFIPFCESLFKVLLENEVRLFGMNDIDDAKEILVSNNKLKIIKLFELFDSYSVLLSENSDKILSKNDNYLSEYLIDKISRGYTLLNILDKLFDPETNGFILATTEDMYKYMDRSRVFYVNNNVLLSKTLIA